MTTQPSRFQRFFLPGLAFKAVVIGGGYATGRELAEFFIPGGPLGGLLGMLLAMLMWSVICTITFMFAQATTSFEYRRFFQQLLGPPWGLFEVAYVLFLILILAVFGAAAGAIVTAMFGFPTLAGTLALMVGIGAVSAFGNHSVERLFKWVSFFLYGVYILFFIFVLTRFGDRIVQGFSVPTINSGWAVGGLTYAGYNIIGAVVILPITRHFLCRRDAVVAGLLAGPLAMVPALLFFICMIGWYPQIGSETLPSDFVLQRLDRPWFHLLFQTMIFMALLESGVGAVHAINERVNAAWLVRKGVQLSKMGRLLIASVLLVGSIFIAARFGLVALIANGYRALAWMFLLVYVLPLLTLGVHRLWRRHS
jgi:uncharacterized membrane protein YkvI